MDILLLVLDSLRAIDIQAALEGGNYWIEVAADIPAAIVALNNRAYDALIVDLTTPTTEMYAFMRAIKNYRGRMPLVVVSSSEDFRDRNESLRCGADWHLVRPIHHQEVHSCLTALADRRAASVGRLLSIGDVTLDLVEQKVSLNGRCVDVTKMEWTLLRLFFENPQRIFYRHELGSQVRGTSDSLVSNAIDVHIHQLRKKLFHKLIKTVRGVGYRLGVTGRVI